MATQSVYTAGDMFRNAEQLRCTIEQVAGIVDLVIDGCQGAQYQAALFGASRLLELAGQDVSVLSSGLNEMVKKAD